MVKLLPMDQKLQAFASFTMVPNIKDLNAYLILLCRLPALA